MTVDHNSKNLFKRMDNPKLHLLWPSSRQWFSNFLAVGGMLPCHWIYFPFKLLQCTFLITHYCPVLKMCSNHGHVPVHYVCCIPVNCFGPHGVCAVKCKLFLMMSFSQLGRMKVTGVCARAHVRVHALCTRVCVHMCGRERCFADGYYATLICHRC